MAASTVVESAAGAGLGRVICRLAGFRDTVTPGAGCMGDRGPTPKDMYKLLGHSQCFPFTGIGPEAEKKANDIWGI
eukprot:scaffold45809_cov90-Phaeocystis_antarctica.AAC.1